MTKPALPMANTKQVLSMTDGEICTRYNQAKDPAEQINHTRPAQCLFRDENRIDIAAERVCVT